MRKFIISDIHGFGNLYYSVMNYLDNLSKEEDIQLYINGDLIDRGSETVDILLDVIRRINENNPKFKIKYLGGNHELMMYNSYKHNFPINSWFFPCNDGKKTYLELEKRFKDKKDELNNIINTISNLNIYHKFEEKINGKNIVLVHAACPHIIKDECDLKIKDSISSYYYVWAREDGLSPVKLRIGNKRYFTIIGHTPNDYAFGYYYEKDGNYLNIDGGVALYVKGYNNYNHYPLVEVRGNYLRILTFNSNNEIIYGNYFDGKYSLSITKEELDKDIEKTKKLV